MNEGEEILADIVIDESYENKLILTMEEAIVISKLVFRQYIHYDNIEAHDVINKILNFTRGKWK